MTYYCLADPHGFYTRMKDSLLNAGYFSDTSDKKLVILGDIMDRGDESLLMQDFILDLLKKDELILVRGNHEDLALDLIKNFDYYCDTGLLTSHHYSNGTIDTMLNLTKMDITEAFDNREKFIALANETPYIKTIIPKSINYFETNKYIFVHGWIPCLVLGDSGYYMYQPDWREFKDKLWSEARWTNGMQSYKSGVYEEGKVILCGHWHTSWGHSHIEKKCTEFGKDADFSPFIDINNGTGIIALDGCTAATGIVNVIKIED